VISGVVFHGDPWSVEAPRLLSNSDKLGYEERVIWYAVLHVPFEPFRSRDVVKTLQAMNHGYTVNKVSFVLKRLTECGYLRRERVRRCKPVHKYRFTVKAREIRRKLYGGGG